VSYRLYLRARDYFDRQQPKEKRILGAPGWKGPGRKAARRGSPTSAIGRGGALWAARLLSPPPAAPSLPRPPPPHPPEYLITIRDTSERSRQLDAAVTPGPTKFTDSHDYLWSTPARLYAVRWLRARVWGPL
jgi:hypothetical protein